MSLFPLGFNIRKFLSDINVFGVAHLNRYEMKFGIPRSGRVFDSILENTLNNRLETVTLPAAGIGSNPVKLQGIDREMPYGRLYEGDLRMVFLETSDFKIRDAFLAWQSRVVDPVNYTVGYYEDYICPDLEIVVSNQKNEKVHEVVINDVFPKNVNAIELSGGSEELVKTEVELSFRRWTTR